MEPTLNLAPNLISDKPLDHLTPTNKRKLYFWLRRFRWQQVGTHQDIPHGVSGVYVVFDGMDRTKVLYVGSAGTDSGDVRKRVQVWFRKGIGCVVKWKTFKRKNKALMIEMDLIERLKPALNVRGLYKKRVGERLSSGQIDQLKREVEVIADLKGKEAKSQLRRVLREQWQEHEDTKKWFEAQKMREDEMLAGLDPEERLRVLDGFEDLPSPPKD